MHASYYLRATERSDLAHAPRLALRPGDETARRCWTRRTRKRAEAVPSREREHAPYGGVAEIAHARIWRLPIRCAGYGAGRAGPRSWGVAASAGPVADRGLTLAPPLRIATPGAAFGGQPSEAHHLTARRFGRRGGWLSLSAAALRWALPVRRAVDGVGRHARLGGTLDDATGEAFDKVAKLLGLGWPWAGAGAAVGRRRSAAICVSRGRCWGGPGADFSFSGLKTAVAREVARHGTGALPVQIAADIAASFQRAAAEVLADRAAHAMAMMRERSRDAHVLVIAGGVAANSAIRSALAEGASEQGFELVAPPVRLCTDNAVMVAWTGIERLRLGMSDGLEFAPRPRWPL